MNRYHIFALLFALVLTVPTALAYAQADNLPDGEIPINFSEAHLLLIGVGLLGGLTTAYLGSRKAKANDPNYTFDIHRFSDRVIIAVITSVGIAITSAAGFVELNIVTLYLIFASTIGTAELALQGRIRNTGRNTKPTTP